MNPIRSALKRVRLLSDMPEMDSPPTNTSPPSNSSRPDRQFRSVVFPHPDGPIMATISPRGTERSTPRRARTRTPTAAYSFSMLLASTISVSTPSLCSTFSLAFPIKIHSFLPYSLFVDAQVVCSARDGDVVAVCGPLVVPALQVQLSARGANAPVVELQFGGAPAYAEPRGDPVRSLNDDVADAAEDDHDHGARGCGKDHLQAAGTSVHAEGSEPESAQIGDEPRGTAADLDVPRYAGVELDLRETLRPAIEPVVDRDPRVQNGHEASPHTYRRHPIPEASAVEALQVRVGPDDDPMGAVPKSQASILQRTKWGGEVPAAPAMVSWSRATGRDGVPGIHRIDGPRLVHYILPACSSRRSSASGRTCGEGRRS